MPVETRGSKRPASPGVSGRGSVNKILCHTFKLATWNLQRAKFELNSQDPALKEKQSVLENLCKEYDVVMVQEAPMSFHKMIDDDNSGTIVEALGNGKWFKPTGKGTQSAHNPCYSLLYVNDKHQIRNPLRDVTAQQRSGAKHANRLPACVRLTFDTTDDKYVILFQSMHATSGPGGQDNATEVYDESVNKSLDSSDDVKVYIVGGDFNSSPKGFKTPGCPTNQGAPPNSKGIDGFAGSGAFEQGVGYEVEIEPPKTLITETDKLILKTDKDYARQNLISNLIMSYKDGKDKNGLDEKELKKKDEKEKKAKKELERIIFGKSYIEPGWHRSVQGVALRLSDHVPVTTTVKVYCSET